jgi:GAF domain-containing protein
MGHKVPGTSETLVGWVIQNNELMITTEDSDDPDTFKSELLQGAHIQVAIPLQVTGRSLGVIDIQNSTQHIFDDAEFEVLQTLADQLSSAIENARLAQESADAADRAKLISEITTQLSGILEPEQILQSTAQALHRALNNAEIVVKLVPPESSSPPTDEGET